MNCEVSTATISSTLAITPSRKSLASPWQNGIAERWIEICRRHLLDRVIAHQRKASETARG